MTVRIAMTRMPCSAGNRLSRRSRAKKADGAGRAEGSAVEAAAWSARAVTLPRIIPEARRRSVIRWQMRMVPPSEDDEVKWSERRTAERHAITLRVDYKRMNTFRSEEH